MLPILIEVLSQLLLYTVITANEYMVCGLGVPRYQSSAPPYQPTSALLTTLRSGSASGKSRTVILVLLSRATRCPTGCGRQPLNVFTRVELPAGGHGGRPSIP